MAQIVFPFETDDSEFLIKKNWFREENTDYYMKVLIEAERYYGKTILFNELPE